MSDLLPCPFCGGEAHYGHHSAYSIDSSFDFIGCKDCGCMFEYEEPWNARTQPWGYSSRAEAIAAWNRRAIPAADAAHVNETLKSEHDAGNVLTESAALTDGGKDE